VAQFEIDVGASSEAWEALYRAIEASSVADPPPAVPQPVEIGHAPELELDATVALWLGLPPGALAR
jgi:hypothetical protein